MTKELEELREQVEAISVAVTKIRESGISEEALLCLLYEATPSIGSRPSKKVGKRMIAAVLDGMESLEEFVFPAESHEVEK